MSFTRISFLCGGMTAVLILTSISLFIVPPAAAALVLTKEVFSPIPPLTAGSGQNSMSSITLIPSGAMTFSRYHTLQMRTGLKDARWGIQIIVNGIPASQQSAFGTTAFINGYLLSYPTTSDVSFMVAVNGTVPLDAKTNVIILQATELDNAGTPVPGSSLTVNATLVSTSPGNAGYQQVSTNTPPVTPSPTQSAGPSIVTYPVALLATIAGYRYIRARR